MLNIREVIKLYTEYGGLEIRVDLDVALRRRKWAMLVLTCTGAYGRNAFFRPSRLVGAMHEKLIPIFDFYWQKLFFFSITVFG